jgi:hypothetical protein
MQQARGRPDPVEALARQWGESHVGLDDRYSDVVCPERHLTGRIYGYDLQTNRKKVRSVASGAAPKIGDSATLTHVGNEARSELSEVDGNAGVASNEVVNDFVVRTRRHITDVICGHRLQDATTTCDPCRRVRAGQSLLRRPGGTSRGEGKGCEAGHADAAPGNDAPVGLAHVCESRAGRAGHIAAKLSRYRRALIARARSLRRASGAPSPVFGARVRRGRVGCWVRGPGCVRARRGIRRG